MKSTAHERPTRAPVMSSVLAPRAFTQRRPMPIAPMPFQGHYAGRSAVVAESYLRSQSYGEESDSEREESESSSSESAIESTDGGDSDGGGSACTSSASASSASSSYSSESSSASDSEDTEPEDGVTVHFYDPTASVSTRVMSSSTPRTFWHSDNLGVLALLIPVTGISTMVLTEVLACYHHFDCSQHYPTLSYAAEFKPEGHAFTLGMCTTAIFILASVALFHWFLRLRLLHPAADQATRLVAHTCLGSGAIAAVSLFGLAVFDMGAYHDTHIAFTVLFFIFAWVTMIAVQSARRRLLRQDYEDKVHKPSLISTCAQLGGMAGVGSALQRWKRMSTLGAYQLGRAFLYAGLTATGLFGLLFLSVNGIWPNPLGFTAVQEALLEAFAIFCQLFFMGTLSCELSMLTRVVEHRDYQELERVE